MQVKTKINKSILLVGLMGCGKSCVGNLLAKHYKVPFYDSDAEIVKAANISIADFFAKYGEAEFRKGEEKVMARLLTGQSPAVIAAGGGAFVSENTRKLAASTALSVWLDADIDVLVERTKNSTCRPLLKNTDVRTKLTALLKARERFYAQAQLVVPTYRENAKATAKRAVRIIDEYFKIMEARSADV